MSLISVKFKCDCSYVVIQSNYMDVAIKRTRLHTVRISLFTFSRNIVEHVL